MLVNSYLGGLMNKSESIKELATALAKAQGAIKGAVKDSANPFFKSKYADLASVVEAIRSAFAANGLSYVQSVEPSDKDEVRVETTILHSSGEWIGCGVLALPVSKVDAQGYGSALTYARRYSLSAATGVAPEDDDGNAATVAKPSLVKKMDGVEKALLVIGVSPSLKDLQAVFTDAYKAAQAADDKAAMTIFTAAKNKRKAELSPKDPFVIEMEANQ
tara:strand:+ start:320 stop:973 length:654 start_codon:yes stop_codon:yes gene_type:complete